MEGNQCYKSQGKSLKNMFSLTLINYMLRNNIVANVEEV